MKDRKGYKSYLRSFAIVFSIIACFLIAYLGIQLIKARIEIKQIKYRELSGFNRDFGTDPKPTVYKYWEFPGATLFATEPDNSDSWCVRRFDLSCLHVQSGERYHLCQIDYTVCGCDDWAFSLLWDNYYALAYNTGGRMTDSQGLYVFRIISDTVVFIGAATGYEDVDEDGKKEIYQREWGTNDSTYLEKIIIQGDSLVSNDEIFWEEGDGW